MRKLMILALMIMMWAGGALAQDDEPFDPVEFLTVEVISEREHDAQAFTQGLLFNEADGLLYESTGRYGQSTLRAVDPQTGEVVRRFDLPEEVFAEGLALINDRLYQISWQEQIAVVYELATGADEGTFEPALLYQYPGEGWGLCADGEFLYMSDGSNTIVVRDPETFQPVRNFRVSLYGVFVDQLNELECVGDDLWMNVWQSDTILRVDKQTGAVTGVVDASNLLSEEQQASLAGGAVLNGIAYDAENDVFLITGKLWPSLFEVRFVPVEVMAE